jgi:methylthioribose-1-phosphate isomerase
MKINGIWQHSIVVNADSTITVLDQRNLPHQLTFHRIARWQDAAMAIKEMVVRGAPLIGAVGAYGLAMALQDGEELESTLQALLRTRPTAVNLAWALNRVHQAVRHLPAAQQASHAWHTANTIAQEDIAINSMIGDNGLEILKTFHMKQPEKPIQILTHCNAGWLATLDWGTALAPIYKAFDAGIPVHVWVDETRPRLQGANLTCWELAQHGVPHTLITDNTGGHLMQRGMVDICVVGADRVTRNGDACNKIGTYLKALAANAHNVPFYIDGKRAGYSY